MGFCSFNALDRFCRNILINESIRIRAFLCFLSYIAEENKNFVFLNLGVIPKGYHIEV